MKESTEEVNTAFTLIHRQQVHAGNRLKAFVCSDIQSDVPSKLDFCYLINAPAPPTPPIQFRRKLYCVRQYFVDFRSWKTFLLSTIVTRIQQTDTREERGTEWAYCSYSACHLLALPHTPRPSSLYRRNVWGINTRLRNRSKCNKSAICPGNNAGREVVPPSHETAGLLTAQRQQG